MRYLLIALFSVLLTACGTTKYVTETKIEYIYITPSENMMMTIPMPTPPEVDIYMSADFVQRESMLTEYSSELMGSLHSCNANLKSIQEFVSKAKK